MAHITTTDRLDRDELLTLPEISRRYGIGIVSLRRLARSGAFALYDCNLSWPRVRHRDFEAWLETTNFDTDGVQRRPLSAQLPDTSL